MRDARNRPVPPSDSFPFTGHLTVAESDTVERWRHQYEDAIICAAVNRAAGSPTSISSTVAEVIALALRAAATSGGRFDPTVLGALLAAGYDRDFDELVAGARDVLHPVRPAGRWRDVCVTRATLHMPADVGLDLGGIVKGWTCDRAAERALAVGLPWVLVDAGGDLRILGDAPRIAVGRIADYTGKEESDGSGRKVTQGASLMAVSAFAKAGMPLVERFDTSVSEFESKLWPASSSSARSSR